MDLTLNAELFPWRCVQLSSVQGLGLAQAARAHCSALAKRCYDWFMVAEPVVGGPCIVKQSEVGIEKLSFSEI